MDKTHDNLIFCPVWVTIGPGYDGNVVNVFRDSGSKTSSLSMN